MFCRLFHFLLLGLLLNVPCVVFAQAHGIPTATEQQDPLSASKAAAVQEAKRFLQVCHLPPIQGNVQAEQDAVSLPALVWELTCNGYTFDVEASTGRVINFQNYRRRDQRYHGLARTAAQRFGSLEEAGAEVWRLAHAIGVPDHAYIYGATTSTDTELIGRDQNPVDIGVGITWKLAGGTDYPLLGRSPSDTQVPGISFLLDSQDGQLVSLSQSRRSVVETGSVQLTGPQAVSIAQEAYQKWYSQDESLIPRDNPSDPSAPELGYITRSGLWDFINNTSPPRTDPLQRNLAWGVYFGKASVFVDAVTGAVLGGDVLKGVPGHNVQHPAPKVEIATDGGKADLSRLLHTAVGLRVYSHQPKQGAPGRLIASLGKASNPGMFSTLKSANFYQAQPPFFTDCDFVILTSGGSSRSLHYDHESGLLGMGDKWVFVPQKFRTWLASRATTGSSY